MYSALIKRWLELVGLAQVSGVPRSAVAGTNGTRRCLKTQ